MAVLGVPYVVMCSVPRVVGVAVKAFILVPLRGGLGEVFPLEWS
jgi:hypothetical protein